LEFFLTETSIKMYLFEELNSHAEDSIKAFLEDMDNNLDSDDEYEKWTQEFVNSPVDWWNFSESDLNARNLNILLETNAKFVEEFQSEQPLDVSTLLGRYGLWQVLYQEPDHFRDMWNDEWRTRTRTSPSPSPMKTTNKIL